MVSRRFSAADARSARSRLESFFRSRGGASSDGGIFPTGLSFAGFSGACVAEASAALSPLTPPVPPPPRSSEPTASDAPVFGSKALVPRSRRARSAALFMPRGCCRLAAALSFSSTAGSAFSGFSVFGSRGGRDPCASPVPAVRNTGLPGTAAAAVDAGCVFDAEAGTSRGSTT